MSAANMPIEATPAGERTTAPPATVQLVTDMEGIESLREPWARLAWHPNSDIDFYCQVLASIPGARPWVLTLARDGAAAAILVGRLEETHLKLRIGYLAIPGPRTRTVTFIYGGLLGSCTPEDARLLAGRIRQALREDEADAIAFNHLRTDSPLYAAIQDPQRFGTRDRLPTFQTHRRLHLPASAAEFRNRLSPRVRKNLRWEAKKLIKDYEGQVTVRCVAEPAELPLMIREVESVAARTYQRGMGAGFSTSPAELARLQLKAEHGWLRAYLLYLKGHCTAFWVGTLYAGTLHSDYLGFDPDYRSSSPGTYLIVSTAESLCRPQEKREIHAIDFGLGDAMYKRLFGDECWQDVCLSIFAPTLRGHLRSTLRFLFLACDQLGRKLLNVDLERKLKRLWRDALSQGGRLGKLMPFGKPNPGRRD